MFECGSFTVTIFSSDSALLCPCRADVLAYDRSRGAHHVLYEDGEDEWLKLPAEVVSWQKGTPARSLGAGLSFGARPVEERLFMTSSRFSSRI